MVRLDAPQPPPDSGLKTFRVLSLFWEASPGMKSTNIVSLGGLSYGNWEETTFSSQIREILSVKRERDSNTTVPLNVTRFCTDQGRSEYPYTLHTRPLLE